MRTRLVWCALAAVACAEVASKFSLRNLSGEYVGLWWLEPRRGRAARKMVPQSKVGIRDTSAIEINSYRGHEFLLRVLPGKGAIEEGLHDARPDDAILVIGATNDLVVFNSDFELVRHDAAWFARRAVREAFSRPFATSASALADVSAAIERWRGACASRLARSIRDSLAPADSHVRFGIVSSVFVRVISRRACRGDRAIESVKSLRRPRQRRIGERSIATTSERRRRPSSCVEDSRNAHCVS